MGMQALLAVHRQPWLRLRGLADERGKAAAEPALLKGYDHGYSCIPDTVRHLVFLCWVCASLRPNLRGSQLALALDDLMRQTDVGLAAGQS